MGVKVRGYDLINHRYAAAFNQFYGVETRIPPVWIEHPDICPIIPPSFRAGFVLTSAPTSRRATVICGSFRRVASISGVLPTFGVELM
jgi:hypothetical protein